MSEETTEAAEVEAAPPDPAVEAQGRLEAAIATMSEESTETAEEPAKATAKEPDSSPSISTSDTATKEGPAVEETKDAVVSPQLAALTRKEKRQRQQHEARMGELKEREAQIAEQTAKLQEWEQAKKYAASDPVRLFKALGVEKNLADPAQALYLAELGDDAPGDVKARAEQAALRGRLAALESENEAAQQRAVEQQKKVDAAEYINGYKREVRSDLESVESLPHVERLFKVDPAGTVDAIYAIALHDAQGNPEAPIAKTKDLAQRLEAAVKLEYEEQKSTFADIYGDSNDTEEKAKATGKKDKKPAPKTLSNQQTATPTQKRTAAQTEQEKIQRAVEALESGGW